MLRFRESLETFPQTPHGFQNGELSRDTRNVSCNPSRLV